MLVGILTFLYWLQILPLQVLLVAIGTEIFVTVATIVALLGGEYVAGAVLMCIILSAEFIVRQPTDAFR